jgi:predicted transcriptional regulator
MIENLVNALFGCRHKRLTRPITPVRKPGTPSGDTYVACLECGKRFHYDPHTMSIGTAMPLAPASYRPFSSPFRVQ